jgi:hypothetical protein
MSVRIPKILDDVIEHNRDYPSLVLGAIARLRDDIRTDAALPPLGFPAPDAAEWESERAEREGQTWLATEWFFAEEYVYRSLMTAVRYWESGRDPFAPVKREELASDNLWQGLDAVLPFGPQAKRERLHALLGLALWGNRVDLSYQVGVAFGRGGNSEDLLCDDRDWAIEQLLDGVGDVHIVLDNTGSELSMDLVLAEAILSFAGTRVVLHVKAQPTFVSDAIVADVWMLVGAMKARGGEAAELSTRLETAFADQRLMIAPDFFWTGPRFLWDRPARFTRELDGARIVILKGDANYRRAVGDALWPPESPFAEVTSYFPAPLLALRTLKSDPVVGLPTGLASKLDAEDPEWRINGRRGIIQGNRSSRG